MNTKAIKNYEELYTVSENGTVTSIKTGKVLKQELIKRSNTNYKRIALSKDGKVTRFQVHQLVAIHFINNPEDKEYVNHIDNNGENNLYTNLEWCTHSENMIHCIKQGRGTYSDAAKQTVLNKLSSREEKLKSVLGANFIAINKQARSTVTYLCQKCNKPHTTRLDSTALTQPTILCRNCSYAERHSK